MAAPRKALGRGLSALISPSLPREEVPTAAASDASPSGEADSGPLYIALDKIHPNPSQPRKLFRDEELATLAQSIREQGILQPLVVRRDAEGYELIIGERRWRASRLAGLQQVPAVVLEASDRQVLEMALVENVQRAELNAIELAHAFEMLIEEEDMTQEELGQRVGLERSTVANHLRLLELQTEIQQDLIDLKLTMGHAKALLQAPESKRLALRELILRDGLSVRSSEELARRAAAAEPDDRPRPGPVRDLHLTALEDRLRRGLQTKVRIVGRPTKGRIELQYQGDSDLQRIVERLIGRDL
jgi:ParB family transcriptional regulator, chromosome partitioning protein